MEIWSGRFSKNKKEQVLSTSEQGTTEKLKRTYIFVSTMKKIKFQIDAGSDLTIISAETWKICPTLNISKKGVTGKKLKFMGENSMNVFFNGKERKLKAFVMLNVRNSF